MKTTTIKVNGADIVLKFGYGFLRLLGDVWHLAGPAGIMQKFLEAAQPLVDIYASLTADPDFEKNVTDSKTVELPFASMDAFVDVVLTAAYHQNNAVALDKDAVVDFLYNNPEIMGEITRLFMESMPRVAPQENEGKPIPAEAPGQ